MAMGLGEQLNSLFRALVLSSMSLCTLSDDAWSLVSEYLSTTTIFRLKNVGSPQLRSLVERSTSRLVFSLRRTPMCVWDSIFAFKRLRELIIDRTTRNWFSKSDFSPTLGVLPPLPEDLRVLRMGFNDCVPKDLDNVPRTVTDLEMHINVELNEEIMRLPPNLVDFKTRSSIHPSALAHLPSQLTSLDLATRVTNDTIPVLPRSLTHLVLRLSRSVDDVGVKSLPPNLLCLHLLSCRITSYGVSLLPQTLTELNLTDDEELDVSVLTRLPPNLVRFTFSGSWLQHLRDDMVPKLPRSLKAFYTLACNHLTPASVDFLPIDFIRSGYVLPSSLRRAAIPKYIASSESTTFIAPNWVESRMGELEMIQLVPRHVTGLCLNQVVFVDQGYWQSVPPNLTSLVAKEVVNLTDDDVRILPRTLRTLHAPLSASLSDAAIAFLPPCLTSLLLSTTTHLTNSCIPSLPSTLTLLHLPKSGQIDDVGIPSLPRSITSLDLSWSRKLTDTCISHLPPALTWLKLTSASLLTNACAKRFPRSLTFLDISRAASISKRRNPDLPPLAKII